MSVTSQFDIGTMADKPAVAQRAAAIGGKLANIQILRAVAAFMVVIYHCGMEMTEIGNATGRKLFFDHDPWGTGVVLFFAISGFIMVATNYNAFGKPGAPLDFMKRRVMRIVPLYWVITTLAVIGVTLAPQMLKVPVNDIGYIVSSYLFWPEARVNGLVRPLATPGWTLNLEMMFYVVFAVALLFPRRVGLAFTLIMLGGMSLCHVLGVFAADGALASVPLNFWSDPIIIGFMLGMLVGVFYEMGFRIPGWPALAIAAIGMMLLMHSAIPGLPEDNFYVRIADAVPAAIVLTAFALGPQIDGSRLAWRFPLAVGEASYSLYLTHEFILRPFRSLWLAKLGAFLPYWSFLAFGSVLALTVGFGCYYVVERPASRLLNPKNKHAKLVTPVGAQSASA